MASFAVEHAKSKGYNELAELAVATTTKVARATEPGDINAILKDYFHKTIGVMRRVGMACKSIDQIAPINTPTSNYNRPPPRRWKAPDNFGAATIGERIGK